MKFEQARKPFSVSRIGLIAFAALLLFAFFYSPVRPVPSVGASAISFMPTDDTFVSASHATRSFGFEKSLRVDTSPEIASFMKFVVSGVPSGPWKATLKLRNAKASQVGYQLRAVT